MGTRGARQHRAVLRRALRAAPREVLGCLCAGLAWQAAAVAVPWVLERAVDDGVLGRDRAALWRWCLVLVGLGIVRWAGDAARHWWVERAGARAVYVLRRDVIDRLLQLSDDDLQRFDQGDLTARAVSDTNQVRVWISGIATYVTASGTLVAVLGLLLTLDLRLALIGLLTVPLAALLARHQAGTHHRLAAAVAADTGAYTTTVETSLSGIRAVKGLGAEPAMAARVAVGSERLRWRAIRLADVEGWWLGAAAAIPAAGLAAGLWLGGSRAIESGPSVGALVAFAGWMALLVDATVTLTDRLSARSSALAAAERLGELLVERTTDPPDAVAAPTRRDLSLDRLTVARGDRLVLDGIDLDVPGGSWLGIVGATASGKTTLLRAAAGLAEPTVGRVRIGGVDLRDVSPASRSGLVALVPQNPMLVSGSIADLLRLGAPGALDAELVAAIGAAGATDVLDAAGGLHGVIGDRGLTLSGGQRQRLAIAAAVLVRPPVLLLDDPTSALDPATEIEVLRRLRRELPGTTVVLTTHRDRTAAVCDRVVVLADGGIVDASGADLHALLGIPDRGGQP